MNLLRKTKRAVAIAAMTGAIAGGSAVVATTSAQAATPHYAKICARGNYAAYLQVPQQGGISTFVAFPGKACQKVPLASYSTYAKVWGLYNNHRGQRFYVGTAHFNARTGWTGGAMGKTTSHSLKNYG